MAEFMMIMKGAGENADWKTYIDSLMKTGLFRGGSALSNGLYANKQGSNRSCVVTGFMRFEADNLHQIRALLTGNPVYESGGEVELLELIET